jgi:nitrite reductase/ring-hydroxylating ferredoxin subunit
MNKTGSSRNLAWIRNVQRRLAQHVTAKTTEHTTTKVHYTNAMETYFSAQRDQVAKNAATAPYLVMPSCLLPASHAVAVTVDPTSNSNTPLFVHRNAQSHQVRAYKNQCRHRGAQLIKNNSSKPGLLPTTTPIRGSAIICPYHSFTYDVTTGALKGIPGGSIGFPCLNKEQHGLHPVDCFETAGGIWLGERTRIITILLLGGRRLTRSCLVCCHHHPSIIMMMMMMATLLAIVNGNWMRIGSSWWKRF